MRPPAYLLVRQCPEAVKASGEGTAADACARVPAARYSSGRMRRLKPVGQASIDHAEPGPLIGGSASFGVGVVAVIETPVEPVSPAHLNFHADIAGWTGTAQRCGQCG
jgi:hypothetical protein